MLYFVYEWIDPRTGKARYVGITNNPNARLKGHLEDIDTNAAKAAWISKLTAQKLEPRMHVLEIVDNLEQAREREKYWIGYYLSLSEQLLNIQLVYGSREQRPRSHQMHMATSAARSREIKPPPCNLPPFSSRPELVFSQQPGYVSAEEAAQMLGVDIRVFHRAIKPILLGVCLHSRPDPFRKDALNDFSDCWFSVARIREYVAYLEQLDE